MEYPAPLGTSVISKNYITDGTRFQHLKTKSPMKKISIGLFPLILPSPQRKEGRTRSLFSKK